MSQETKPAAPVERPPFYRRRYLIDKPFQYRMIGTLLAIWLANSVFFTLVLYLLYDGHLNQFYDLVPREGAMPLLSLPALFGVSVFFISVFSIIVLGIIALYLSNQIAGPLYRTKLSLDRVGQGDWAFHLQFRHTDFLTDFPGVFNAMLDNLRQQTVEELELLKAIEAEGLDSTDASTRLRKLREKKEAQLGLATETETTGDSVPVSVAVH